jgi:hypothetical protein
MGMKKLTDENNILLQLTKDYATGKINAEIYQKYYKISDNLINTYEEQDEDFRCGDGDNRCNCKTIDECGYIEMFKRINKYLSPLPASHETLKYGNSQTEKVNIVEKCDIAFYNFDLCYPSKINGSESQDGWVDVKDDNSFLTAKK